MHTHSCTHMHTHTCTHAYIFSPESTNTNNWSHDPPRLWEGGNCRFLALTILFNSFAFVYSKAAPPLLLSHLPHLLHWMTPFCSCTGFSLSLSPRHLCLFKSLGILNFIWHSPHCTSSSLSLASGDSWGWFPVPHLWTARPLLLLNHRPHSPHSTELSCSFTGLALSSTHLCLALSASLLKVSYTSHT